MGSAEMRLKIIAPSFGKPAEWNSGSIGSNQSTGLPVDFNFGVQALLDFQVFHNCFQNPIAAGYVGKVVIEVSCADS